MNENLKKSIESYNNKYGNMNEDIEKIQNEIKAHEQTLASLESSNVDADKEFKEKIEAKLKDRKDKLNEIEKMKESDEYIVETHENNENKMKYFTQAKIESEKKIAKIKAEMQVVLASDDKNKFHKYSELQDKVNDIEKEIALYDEQKADIKKEYDNPQYWQRLSKSMSVVKDKKENPSNDNPGKDYQSNDDPEPQKGRADYDWGDLTEDQIDELWAEGITPDTQEYKQAYSNFAKMPSYEPKVHDDVEPESNPKPNPNPDPLPKPGTPQFQPPAPIPVKESRLEKIGNFFFTMSTPIRFIGRNLVVRPFKFILKKIRGMQEEVTANDEMYGKMQDEKAEKKDKKEENKTQGATEPKDIGENEDALDKMIRRRDEAAKNGTGRPRLDGEGNPVKPWEESAKDEIAEGVQKAMEKEHKSSNPWEVYDPKVKKATEEVGRNAGKNDENSKPAQEKDSGKEIGE